MKVLSAKEMARVEALSFSEYGKDQESKFMEKAGQAIANFFLLDNSLVKFDFGKKIFLLCGKGNNAGDGYVAGRYLQEQGYSVTALQVFDEASASPLARSNMEKFKWVGGNIVAPDQCLEFSFPKKGVIIDGLLGTGSRGPVRSPLSDIIARANQSRLPILAIDLPSGLDANTGALDPETTIRATWTLTLEAPKSGFFLGDAWNYIGHLCTASFGLQKDLLHEAKSDFTLLTEKRVAKLIPTIRRTRHKYERGSLAILAGSKGMSGAAMLASHASLRAGAGLVRLLHPEAITVELAQAPKELIKVSYSENLNTKSYDALLKLINSSKAVLIGPGLTCSDTARNLLKNLVPRIECPSVLDADALNLFAEEKFSLPAHTILTPHMGEMARLLGIEKAPPRSFDFLAKCQDFVKEKKITLVLKGAPTFVLHPGKNPYVCTKGDPGMATAGSGDVLAGVLAALLAQGLSTRDAALLGVFLHGLAGEKAAYEKTSYAMLASDIIQKLPDAYAHLKS